MASRRGSDHQLEDSRQNEFHPHQNNQQNQQHNTVPFKRKNEPYNRRTNYQHNSVPTKQARSSTGITPVLPLKYHHSSNLSMSAHDLQNTPSSAVASSNFSTSSSRNGIKRRPKPLNAKDYKKNIMNHL